MENKTSYSSGIRQISTLIVNVMIGASLWVHLAVWADEPAEKLPKIEAKSYKVTVVRHSKSQKTYLIEAPADSVPPLGKIVLLRSGDENKMAFRVVKTYPGKTQFAGRRVRTYEKPGAKVIAALESNETFRAIQKIADVPEELLKPVSPQEQKEIQNDLKEFDQPEKIPEVAPTTEPVDLDNLDDLDDLEKTDLDRLEKDQAEKESQSQPSTGTDEEPETGNDEVTVIEEIKPLDFYKSWLSAEFGVFRNASVDGGSTYYAGGGLRFGYTVGERIWQNKANLQDSFAIELGVFFYSISGFSTAADAYSVMPIIPTLRYNLWMGETMGVFFYGGLMLNIASAGTTGTPTNTALLGGVTPALGTGLLFHAGPNWDLRVDLGLDMLGGGLMLRF